MARCGTTRGLLRPGVSSVAWVRCCRMSRTGLRRRRLPATVSVSRWDGSVRNSSPRSVSRDPSRSAEAATVSLVGGPGGPCWMVSAMLVSCACGSPVIGRAVPSHEADGGEKTTKVPRAQKHDTKPLRRLPQRRIRHYGPLRMRARSAPVATAGRACSRPVPYGSTRCRTARLQVKIVEPAASVSVTSARPCRRPRVGDSAPRPSG